MRLYVNGAQGNGVIYKAEILIFSCPCVRGAVGIGLPSAPSAGRSILSIEIKARKGPWASVRPWYDIVL